MRILNSSRPSASKKEEAVQEKFVEKDLPTRKSAKREVKQYASPGKELSDRDIRSKIEKMKMKKDVKTTKPKGNGVKSDMPGDVSAKVVNAQGEPIKSDVSKNNPNDPAVREKLRELLKSGAFSFNQKEKGTLAQILKEE